MQDLLSSVFAQRCHQSLGLRWITYQIAFTSDGASVMLGVQSGVGTTLEKKFPALLLWHRLNYRLQLAISDAASSINGFYPMQAFFYEIYTLCSPTLPSYKATL